MNQEVKQNSRVYLLDTNHCSRIIASDPVVVFKLNELASQQAIFVTCSIVSGELFFMAYKSKQVELNLNLIVDFLNDLEIYPINDETSKYYGELKANLLNHYGPKEKNKRIKTKIEEIGFTENDLWIAAVTMQYQIVLVSSDGDFKRMNDVIDLKVESWV